jgi:hypothetical protein
LINKSSDFTSSKLGMPVISAQLEKIAHVPSAILYFAVQIEIRQLYFRNGVG